MSLHLYLEITRSLGIKEPDPPSGLGRVVEGLPSCFDVSGLAEASIAAAAVQVAALSDRGPQNVNVDRRLCGLWFGWSLRPQGWVMPNPWDPIAGDYKARDGWIRLHTNAPHHRAAALRVLGTPEEKEAVIAAVAQWDADELEVAVVEAGGCAVTPSHAVKKGRRYRYYVSASLITEAGTDRAQGWRLAAREVEDTVITILIDALSSPARLLDGFGTSGMSGDQARKIHARAARLVAALIGSPEQRSPAIRALVEQVIVDEQTIIIKVRRGPLLDRPMSSALDAPSDGAIELTAAVSIKRRGVGTRLVLLDGQQNLTGRCDPALVKAIARGRAWFDELVTGRVRSLQELAKRDGISRRYIRRLVGLAFLRPQLVEAILHGRQPVKLTATRLTELDLPLDWAEQHRLLTT